MDFDLDNLEFIFPVILMTCLAGFIIWGCFTLKNNTVKQNKIDEIESIKTELEIENLKLDNELKKLQLEQLGFDFAEFEISNIESNETQKE